MSAALWLSTIDFALTASKPVTFWLYGNDLVYADPSIIEGDPINRSSLMLLFAAGLLVLARRRIEIARIATLNPAVAVLLAYLALSVVWSGEPMIALKRYFREIGHIIMVLVVLTDSKPVEAIERVLLRCVYILVPLSVLYIKYYPGLGRTYSQWTGEAMYTGVTTNKNTLGMLVMLSTLFVIWRVLRSPKLLKIANVPDLIALAMSTWLLSISNSKTSIACFSVGLFVLLVLRTQWIRPRRAMLKLGVATVFVLTAAVFMAPSSRGYVAEQLGRDATLTTRTDIWERAIALDTNPIVGAGYNSVWLTPAGRSLVAELSLAHAHNGYLEVYLNTGIVGVILLVIMLSTAVGNSVRVLGHGEPLGSLLVTWCVVVSIYNLSEVTFNKDNILTLGLFIAAIRLDRHRHFATPIAEVRQVRDASASHLVPTGAGGVRPGRYRWRPHAPTTQGRRAPG